MQKSRNTPAVATAWFSGPALAMREIKVVVIAEPTLSYEPHETFLDTIVDIPIPYALKHSPVTPSARHTLITHKNYLPTTIPA